MGIRKRNFQRLAFVWRQTHRVIFKSALVYSNVSTTTNYKRQKNCLYYVHIIFEINIVIAIPSYLSFPTSSFDISCVIMILKSKIWACKTKKWLNKTYKTTCYKTKSNFSQLLFSHWLLHKCFFSFLTKAFANFEKLIRFHWQAFIVYKNGENLKMLIEVFCQKLIASNVILAFLDHLKHKIFFAGQPWWPT